MRKVTTLLLLSLCPTLLFGQASKDAKTGYSYDETKGSVMHNFGIWELGDQVVKLYLYVGWTNGYFSEFSEDKNILRKCMNERMHPAIAILMIDKYSREHPEAKGEDFTKHMRLALTAKGGPCEDKKSAAKP